jgi:hypothetical protein
MQFSSQIVASPSGWISSAKGRYTIPNLFSFGQRRAKANV